jgi:hypothetical protein
MKIREKEMKALQKSNGIKYIFVFFLMLSILFMSNMVYATIKHSKGQTVYLSVYPLAERSGRMKPRFLKTTLTSRNTDLQDSLTIVSIKYYNSNGEFKRNVIKKPMVLKALASHPIVFDKKELQTAGMTGCFIIEWESVESVNPPIFEGIMAVSTTGVVETMIFHGKVLEEKIK